MANMNLSLEPEEETKDESFNVEVSVGDLPISNELRMIVGTGNEIPAKKPGRPKKNKEENTTPDLPMTASNVPYKETYAETDNILRQAIGELGKAATEIGQDLDDIRASRTLRKKYDYISALQSSRATVINTIVSAAREMNNSIKNSHELDLKRAKDMRLSEAEKDDVKSIQDMYNAFVSMPVQQNMGNPQFMSPLGPMTSDLTMAGNNINGYLPVSGADIDAGYNNYMNNMTPEQLTMLIEENPHINQVITYNPETGAADFEVYNSETGQFIQGVPKKSAEMFMQDMQFDFQNMQAHSNNLNESYEVIYVDTKGNPKDKLKNHF